jgi:Holliday junction DNA helicase RuvA
MISRISGTLESVDGAVAQINPGQGLTYEVMLPAFVATRLATEVGRPITLETIHYLEGSSVGSNFTPRLAGFLTPEDREFFDVFTTVKGIGPKKALRAMAMATSQIAGAIQDRDLKFLQSLPEIGRRMAETIVATLHGKLDQFIAAQAYTKSAPAPGSKQPAAAPRERSAASETLEILLQLGENRAQAMQWIDDVLQRNPDLTDSQKLLAEVLRLKAGV